MQGLTSSKHIFTLTKYSHATYKQYAGVHSTQALKGEYDWQHHTQPTLRLLLELAKSAEGVPESLRLRVVWTVDNFYVPKNSKHPQPENTIFEDVDLLVVRKHVHPFPTQGLPLKAVFRDTMVGIRYLPPQARSNNPSEYRRFQITFLSSSDSTAFLEIIRDVCPCKPSPAIAAAPSDLSVSALQQQRRSDIILGSQQPQATLQTQSQNHMFQIHPMSQVSSTTAQGPAERLAVPPTSSQSQPNSYSDLPVDFTVPTQQSRSTSSVVIPLSDSRLYAHEPTTSAAYSSRRQSMLQTPRASTQMDLPSSSSPAPFHNGPQTQQWSEIDVQQNYLRRPSMPTRNPAPSARRNLEQTRSDPNLALPAVMPTPPGSSQGFRSSGVNAGPSICMLPPPMPADRTETQADADANTDTTASASAKQPLLESLYEACKLDHLPRDELEQLVAQVVRENGFAELLEKVDSLWQMRALVDV